MTTAIELAIDRGIAGVTTARLARRLGFTEAALYRYYPSKAAILAAAMQHLADQLFSRAGVELTLAVRGGDEVEQALTRHIRHFTENRALLLELLVCAAAGNETVLSDAANAFVLEYVLRVSTYFEQLRGLGAIATRADGTELSRLWLCQLMGGYVRCRLAREPWEPSAQQGFQAFVAMLSRASTHDEPVLT